MLTLGKLGMAHGVKGWLKVHSSTEPADNIFNYAPWTLVLAKEKRDVKVRAWRRQGEQLLVHLEGIDGREDARLFVNASIQVAAGHLPSLDDGEYYWHQLEGLRVLVGEADQERFLGRVSYLEETGANDVLVVRGCEGSIDDRERWIPWLDHVVREISLEEGWIRVDWDPDF